jgi:hypothetical protein
VLSSLDNRCTKLPVSSFLLHVHVTAALMPESSLTAEDIPASFSHNDGRDSEVREEDVDIVGICTVIWTL